MYEEYNLVMYSTFYNKFLKKCKNINKKIKFSDRENFIYSKIWVWKNSLQQHVFKKKAV